MQEFQTLLLNWYKIHKRPLPWRCDKDPYHVWISEIMLQQTRIEAVKSYYKNFMEKLPDIHALAQVDEDTLLKLWQGLGYYNRARNLKKAAMIIEKEYNGVFPNEYNQIKELPGIGSYTAGAIGSICFSLKQTAIDGNVLRVIMRIWDCHDSIDEPKTKEKVNDWLLQIMPSNSGEMNEAIMELGETICLPNTACICSECPLNKICLSYQNQTNTELPIRKKKKEKQMENITLLLLTFQNKVALEKRMEPGLLHNLWQFPNINDKVKSSALLSTFQIPLDFVLKIEKSISYQHIFTHKIWNVQIYNIEIKQELENYTWSDISSIQNYAIPTAFRPALKQFEI